MCCPKHPEEVAVTPQVANRFNSNSDLLPKPGVCGGGSTPRIVNGNKTEIYEYPWMALLEYSKRKRFGSNFVNSFGNFCCWFKHSGRNIRISLWWFVNK